MSEVADRISALLPALERPLVFVLVVAIAWTLADGVWFFLGGAETADTPDSEPMALVQRAPRAPLMSAREIAALNLFGEEIDTESTSGPVNAPETRLQLELKGVFLADPDTESTAIVAESNGDGKLYRIGDRVPGNAELVQVHGDRVVLRRAGQLEILRFPFANNGGSLSVNRGRLSGGSRTRTAMPGFDPVTDAGGGAYTGIPGSRSATPAARMPQRSSAGAATSSMRQALTEFQSQLDADPDGTLAGLGVQPVSQGAANGYRLGSEIPASQLAQVGLRPGDVVLSVNGQPVGDIQQDRTQLQAVVDTGRARLEIQRGERRFFVTTQIR